MADRKEKLTFVISALDKATAPFKRMAKAADRMATPFRRMSMQFKGMGQNLGFDRIKKAVGGVRRSFADMGGMVTRLLAPLGALGFALVSVSNNMQILEAQAASVGMSTEALMGYAGAVKALGFDAEKVVDLVEEMNNKIGESKGLGATTPVKEAMHMLKLDLREIARLKPEEQFERIMAAAAKLKDQQKASSAVDILMGGEANKIMGHLRAQAKEQGTTVSELLAKYRQMNLTTDEGRAGLKQFAQSWKDFSAIIQSAFTELMGLIGTQLAPMFKEFSKWLLDNFDEIRSSFKEKLPGAIEAVAAAFRGMYKAVSSIVKFFSVLSDAIGTENTAMLALAGAISMAVIPVVASLTTAIIALGTAIGFTPLGWIAGAFAAVVAVGVTLYTQWDRIKELWREYSDLLYMTPLAPFKLMVDLISKIVSKWDGLVASFKRGAGVFSGIGNAFKNFFGIGDKGGGSNATGSAGAGANRASELAGRSRRASAPRFSEHTNNARVEVDFKNAPEGTAMSTSGDADLSATLNTGPILAGG